MQLKYATIELQLTEALPEMQSAAQNYWKSEGEQGKDAGPYFFFESTFGCYVGVLLAMRASPGRSKLLQRAFGFAEEMLGSSDLEVQNLAYIGLYEGRPGWWLRRAAEFIGVRGDAVLDEFYPDWRKLAKSQESVSGEFIDLHGVRKVIANELEGEGVSLVEIPGSTHVE
jgi:hypothetical protein